LKPRPDYVNLLVRRLVF